MQAKPRLRCDEESDTLLFECEDILDSQTEMNASRNYGQNAQAYVQRAISFLNSDGLIPQILLTIIIVIILHLLIMAVETVVEAVQKYQRLRVDVFPYTYDSGQQHTQKASLGDAILFPSNNELNGMEFSYSSHVYIKSENFGSTAPPDNWKVVFYKGSKEGVSHLAAPAVLVSASTNKMRVYMSTVGASTFDYVEIPNIPIAKWFHLAIVMRGKYMDVYVNGNVTARHEFKLAPKINYSGVFLMQNGDVSADEAQLAFGSDNNVPGGVVKVKGGMNGLVSRLTYYSYAISFSEVDSAMSVGPSSKVITKATSGKNTPPYLHDSWWVTNY